ncbi:mitochondrial import inner membrane translocase subunit TIM13 [Colletotrichum acutatum]
MESTTVKNAVMKQVLQEANLANARVLIEVGYPILSATKIFMKLMGGNDKQKLQENCFEKCVPKPGSSLSSGETTCMTSCMEKYMSAWNQVNQAYIARIKQESSNPSL